MEELWRWPVKSMGGERVGALRVDRRGAAGDRTHAVVGDRGILTARQAPGLLRWRAGYGGADPAPDAPPLATVTAPDGAVRGWDDPALPGALAADLGRPVTLSRDLRGQQDLADSLLITFAATHAALERELATAIDPRRFRTNLHLEADLPAWAELGLEGRRIELEGGVVLELLHPCVRCAIPTRDPGGRGGGRDRIPEKWAGLLKHLHREHGTRYGINARVLTGGELREGYRAWTSASTSATEPLASPNSSAVFSA